MALFTTLFVTFLVAAIWAILKSRWLYVVVPKPYLKTPLSAAGSVISLTVRNEGFLQENTITVRLTAGPRYELVALSQTDITLIDNTLTVPRLSRFETVIAHLLVEGKVFDISDIESVYSKEATGKVVDKESRINSVWRVALSLIIFVFFCAGPFAYGSWMGREMGFSAVDYVVRLFDSFTPSKQLSGYQVAESQRHLSIAGSLADVTKDGRVKLNIDEIVRRGDILEFTFTFTNNAKKTVVVEVSSHSSAAAPSPLSFWDSRIKETFVAVGAKQSRRMQVFLPESSIPKEVVVSYEIQLGGESTYIDHLITF